MASSSVVPAYPWQTSFSGPVASTVAGSDTLTSGKITQIISMMRQHTDVLQAVPTTTLPVYPWNLSPFPTSESSTSSTLTSAETPSSSGLVQHGIPSQQPTFSPVSSVSIATIEHSLPSPSKSTFHTSFPNTTTATSTASTATSSCGTQTAGFTVNVCLCRRSSRLPMLTGSSLTTYHVSPQVQPTLTFPQS